MERQTGNSSPGGEMMPRAKVEILPTIENDVQIKSNIITFERHYKLITPLFGGGVNAGENDTSFLIRATSIRGQLRFWWRAARGSNEHIDSLIQKFGLHDLKYKYNPDGSRNREFTASEKLHLVESWIWGVAAKDQVEFRKLKTLKSLTEQEKAQKRIAQSRVGIRVTKFTEGQVFTDFSRTAKQNNRNQNQPVSLPFIADPKSDFSYAAFPLRESKGTVLSEVEFDLEIQLMQNHPALRAEIEAALWSWQSFGGIGARTRRGFGALSERDTVSEDLATFWQTYSQHVRPASENRIANLPYLGGVNQIKWTAPTADVLDAWRITIEKLRTYRQWRDHNNPTLNPRFPNAPGRSQWVEPDAIRAFQQTAYSRIILTHPIRVVSNQFPRAQIGLPITFKFKIDDVAISSTHGDPQRVTLSHAKTDRFSSPLILRPIKIGQCFYGLALVLAGSRVPNQELMLKDNPDKGEKCRFHNENPRIAPRPLSTQRFPSITAVVTTPPSPMATWSTSTDALQAFLDAFDNL
jgi:CRISPR-associated protein Cmr1